ncbi:hypothetical protein [Paraburkholderia strydomiana]|uniref:hypothetical protein n=1 Tax=Paraburkholderia strydomiana TaxID=1245417 RepID=UPI0038B92DB3
MTIVFRGLKAIFLDLTARFTSVVPRMSNQDRLFLSGHGLDTIREIAQQFPRDGKLGVRVAELQRSREFARDLMDFCRSGDVVWRLHSRCESGLRIVAFGA